MKIKLYLDEDAMDGDLAEALRIRGVDVLTAGQAGMINRDDQEHLEFATSHDRAIYSFNVRDYHRIHTQFQIDGRSHSGIILAQQQRFSLGQQMTRLLKIISSKSAEEITNCIEFLNSWD